MGDVIDGAMQQAPQPGRQETEEDETLTGKVEGVKTGGRQAASILPTGPAVLDWPYPQVYIC
jgi:hypothetical protein